MKKIITLAMALMLGVLFITGCSKKSDSGPSYSMKATIGGTSYSANYSAAANSGGFTAITGLNASGSTATPPYLILYLTNYNKTTGDFTIGDFSTGATNYAAYYQDASTVKTSVSGTIHITSASTSSIVGTFDFKTTDGTQISGGTFTAKGY